MGGIFGSGPSVQQAAPAPTSTTPTLTPAQLAVQSLLSGQLQQYLPGAFSNAFGGQPVIPTTAPGGQYAAPLTGQQNNIIGQIAGAASPGGAAAQPLNSAQQALTQVLSGQPQDFSQYFMQDIAAPQEQVFSQQTLPAIKAAMARSAGGTYSGGPNTGMEGAVTQATESLNNNLQQSATALGTQAQTAAEQQRVQGIGLAPSLASQQMSNLTTALGAAGLPQQVAQQQIAGQQGQSNTALQFLSTLLGGTTNFSNSPTLSVNQGSNIVNPGQPGFLSSAAPGLGAGLGMGLMAMMSDPRLKDIEEEDNPALTTIKRLTVKKAKYKWEPPGDHRHMLMADNVEKIYPKAAQRVAGVGYIKPHELIALLVKGVQELEKKAA